MTDRSATSNAGAQASSETQASSRLRQGFRWGVFATIAMSILMVIGMATGVAPMPEPIPNALVALVFGTILPTPLLIVLSAGSHLGYGGFFGAVLTRLFPEAGLKEGLVLGVLLWLVMELVVLPILG